MKCVRCGIDNNLRERRGERGKCKYCGHPFVFWFDVDSKFTDVFFSNSLKAISFSSENTLFFTPKQLWYFIEKRLISKKIDFNKLIIPLILVYFVIILTFLNPKLTLLTFGTGLGIFLIYLSRRQLKAIRKRPKSFKFTEYEIILCLRRWEEVNGKITNVLPSRKTSEPTEINSEITAYSFDRVIVCDTAKIAQFLIANNFHFEHNCAVLSIDGYPQNIFSTVMQMLRQNPDLKIYAFHDASPHGVSVINQLRTNPNWFMGNNPIIYDLGLLPRHVFTSKNMWILKSDESARQAQRISVNVKQTLSTDEIAWLEEGFYVELESFSPRKLLQVASQGMAKTQAIANGYSSGSDSSLDSPDSGDIVINFDDNSSSQNIVFFASDSFG